MISTNRVRELRQGGYLLDPTVPLVVTGCFWFMSLYPVALSQVSAAFLLAYFPWVLYRRWLRTDRQEFPLLALILAMYWLAYALPLFWNGRQFFTSRGAHYVSGPSLTKALFLAVTGMVALCCGGVLAHRIRWSPRITVDMPNRLSHHHYLGMVLIGGVLLKVFVPITSLGSGVRQLIVHVETIVPTVAFGILFRYCLRREETRSDKLIVVAYLAASAVLGIASGWLGSVVAIGLVCTTIYAYERRRLPVAALLAILPVVLFFQPAKPAFRERYWLSQDNAPIIERLSFWVSESWHMWSQALDDPGSESTKELAYRALDRLSLLQQTANVVELTPEVVPYQYGRLYSYLAVTFIPRFIWPDKPSVNGANAWYQVSYGLTRPGNLDSVSIAAGTLTESYISFGWFGPLLIMLPLGVVVALFQRFFLRAEGSLVFSCIGAAMVPQFLGIEAQLAQYLSGLFQEISVALLVLLPILHIYKSTVSQPKALRSSQLVRLTSLEDSTARRLIIVPNRSFTP